MPGLRIQQGHDSCQPARPPYFNTSGTLQPRPRRHRGPLHPRPRIQVPPHDDRSNHTLARSSAYRGHDSGHGPADISGDLGIAFRRPLQGNLWPRCATHLRGVATIPHMARHQCFHHYGLPPAGQLHRGAIPPVFKECPMLRCPHEQVVDTITSMGDARPTQRANAWHSNIHRRSSFRGSTAYPSLCFQQEQSCQRSATEQLELARTNAAALAPESLDLWRFKSSPFIVKPLCTAKFVYVRDDRLGKSSLAPRYTGPYEVKDKNWDNNTFLLDLGRKTDAVLLTWLKAASVPEEATWCRCWGRDVAPHGNSMIPPTTKNKLSADRLSLFLFLILLFGLAKISLAIQFSKIYSVWGTTSTVTLSVLLVAFSQLWVQLESMQRENLWCLCRIQSNTWFSLTHMLASFALSIKHWCLWLKSLNGR